MQAKPGPKELMIGTDIIEVERFKNLSERFMAKYFTELELEYLKGRRPENVAGIFAAKEAVAKALGTGFAGFSPAAIEVNHNIAGKPEIILHGNAAKIAEDLGIKTVVVSISHCKTLAVAMAMAQ